jgi:hypothetical protein
MRNVLIGFCLLLSSQLAFGSSSTPQEAKNIALIKALFTEYAEKLDSSKLDNYFSKNFILVSNNEQDNYAKFKKEQTLLFNNLQSLKMLSIDDLIAKDNKVVGRVSLKLTPKSGEPQVYYDIFIAQIKDHKIEKMWEVLYPSWDEKLLTPAEK